MIKIVADNEIPFLKGALDRVANLFCLPADSIQREHLMDADALIVRTRTKCNEKLLNGTPVKFIASATIGYDHIDKDYCLSQGIAWTNAPGCNSASVKQYIASALAEIISTERKTFEEITLGIVGAGHVGSEVEALAGLLGLRTLVNDPPRERAEGAGHFTSLDRVLSESDVVTMHVPLTWTGEDRTFHMANGQFFSKIKKKSWFINTSRGEVADSNSLIAAVKSGQLAGVVLDVWENEPVINHELLQLAYIATPHIAGYSADGKANGTAMSVRAVSKYFDLGLDDWYPSSIPFPQVSEIRISFRNRSVEESYCDISRFAYDIMEDSRRLKSSPGSFEQQRESYPIRREPGFLRIVLENDCKETKEFLKRLGYQIVE